MALSSLAQPVIRMGYTRSSKTTDDVRTIGSLDQGQVVTGALSLLRVFPRHTDP